MIRQLNAAMQSKPPEYGQASLTTQYLEAEGALRLTLWGNAAFMAAVFATVETYVKEHEDA